MDINKRKKITFYDEEKYMYLTSNLFSIPTLFGYYNNFYKLSLLNFLYIVFSDPFLS